MMAIKRMPPMHIVLFKIAIFHAIPLPRSLSFFRMPSSSVHTLRLLTKVALGHLRDQDFTILWVVTFMVAVGVAMEGPEIVHDIGKAIARCQKKRFSRDDPHPWITIFAAVGWLLIAIGVAGELWGDTLINSVDVDLQTVNDDLLHDAEIATGNAIEDAGRANDRAAQADLRRVELENRIADIFGSRRLTEEQEARIKEKLKGLKGLKIDVYVIEPGNSFNSSEDAMSFGRNIVGALRRAGTDTEGWLLTFCSTGTQASGVFVISLGDSPEERRIASQVRNALPPEIGVAPETGNVLPLCRTTWVLDSHTPPKRSQEAAIRIVIGRKIQPILTRKMLEPTP
jgi:hypothetical protein